MSAFTASRSSITQEMLQGVASRKDISTHARATSKALKEMTHLISLAPCEIISMLTLPSASVLIYSKSRKSADSQEPARGELTHLNILPATPTMFFMCFPTSDRIAMSREIEICGLRQR